MRLLLALLVLSACAVKGYDLGWRKDDAIAPLLGAPLDALSGCVVAPSAPAPNRACRALAEDIEARLAALPRIARAPEALGARCDRDRCTYANVYERRDVGTALILPVYKRIVLREARIRLLLEQGRWRVEVVSVRDNAPPGYGPVTVGGG